MRVRGKCPVCDSELNPKWQLQVLHRHNVQYFECGNCGLLCTEQPYWLDEAYKSAINIEDTGIIQRSIQFSRITSSIILVLHNIRARFLDYAGGYGFFVRMMRDLGFDFYWYDKYAQNLIARGFEFVPSESNGQEFELVTAFEVLEHIVEPREFFSELSQYSDAILLSTVLKPDDVSTDWWYLGPEHGQHVVIHTRRSLEILAEKLGFKCVSYRNLHYFSKKKVPSRWLFASTIRLSRLISALGSFCTKSLAESDFHKLTKLKSSYLQNLQNSADN